MTMADITKPAGKFAGLLVINAFVSKVTIGIYFSLVAMARFLEIVAQVWSISLFFHYTKLNFSVSLFYRHDLEVFLLAFR